MEDNKFAELLNKEYNWPALYSFKFIVPRKNVSAVLALFPENSTKEKPSKNGNYISVNAKVEMKSAEDVLTIYARAGEVEGVIAL
jgi:putative lipoic acid-binding regulatory protein